MVTVVPRRGRHTDDLQRFTLGIAGRDMLGDQGVLRFEERRMAGGIGLVQDSGVGSCGAFNSCKSPIAFPSDSFA